MLGRNGLYTPEWAVEKWYPPAPAPCAGCRLHQHALAALRSDPTGETPSSIASVVVSVRTARATHAPKLCAPAVVATRCEAVCARRYQVSPHPCADAHYVRRKPTLHRPELAGWRGLRNPTVANELNFELIAPTDEMLSYNSKIFESLGLTNYKITYKGLQRPSAAPIVFVSSASAVSAREGRTAHCQRWRWWVSADTLQETTQRITSRRCRAGPGRAGLRSSASRHTPPRCSCGRMPWRAVWCRAPPPVVPQQGSRGAWRLPPTLSEGFIRV